MEMGYVSVFMQFHFCLIAFTLDTVNMSISKSNRCSSSYSPPSYLTVSPETCANQDSAKESREQCTSLNNYLYRSLFDMLNLTKSSYVNLFKFNLFHLKFMTHSVIIPFPSFIILFHFLLETTVLTGRNSISYLSLFSSFRNHSPAWSIFQVYKILFDFVWFSGYLR